MTKINFGILEAFTLRNLVLYIMIALLLTTVISIVIGYHNFGFTVGFIFALYALAVGLFYSVKNSGYTHRYWHKDFVSRRRREMRGEDE